MNDFFLSPGFTGATITNELHEKRLSAISKMKFGPHLFNMPTGNDIIRIKRTLRIVDLLHLIKL
jgi:hypothetical protein